VQSSIAKNKRNNFLQVTRGLNLISTISISIICEFPSKGCANVPTNYLVETWKNKQQASHRIFCGHVVVKQKDDRVELGPGESEILD
jgi:hypothetical protein